MGPPSAGFLRKWHRALMRSHGATAHKGKIPRSKLSSRGSPPALVTVVAIAPGWSIPSPEALPKCAVGFNLDLNLGLSLSPSSSQCRSWSWSRSRSTRCRCRCKCRCGSFREEEEASRTRTTALRLLGTRRVRWPLGELRRQTPPPLP